MWSPDLFFYLFTALNAVRIVSYVPQILAVSRDPNGASAISYWTWAMWAAANGSTALHATIDIGDATMGAINALNAGCCLTVITITVIKRRRLFRRAGTAITAAEFCPK